MLLLQGRSQAAPVIVNLAITYLNQWSEAKFFSVSDNSPPSCPIAATWSFPTPGTLKMNTNAAVNKHTNKTYLAWILQCHSSTMIVVGCTLIAGIIDILLACRRSTAALSWLKDHNIYNVIIESNA